MPATVHALYILCTKQSCDVDLLTILHETQMLIRTNRMMTNSIHPPTQTIQGCVES